MADLTTELKGLCMDRGRLLRELAPLLKTVGPSHTFRQQEVVRRRRKAKEIRESLHRNAEEIATLAMRITGETP